MMREEDTADGEWRARQLTVDRLRDAVHAVESKDPVFIDIEAEKDRTAVRHRALRLLDHRSRSRQELDRRLGDLEFPAGVVADVLDDLERVGLIDDETFAYEWVRQRHRRRGKSRDVLDRELRDKGVAPELRIRALDQIAEADERAMALHLARKKAQTTVACAPRERADRDRALRRILGVLGRRGFPQGMSMELAREALEERISELS
ncbi:recombination regulator RecX [Corynebacterium sp. CCM 9185]|uniref:Regulatory protein RecX n=1 Tax=Corynebacterium marambiense TaxID=2765364 RepID=A0ABS0VV79_9CORY|nr:regulatory protein RecX [Corynebacterium marambiense]MBI9000660.1 regulatory protein RecX [Corynebacterium marambiense]MCK7663077.1 recombination regulator RecX [Corynebacterium marambiense]MCX7542691.1 regulatory protein RecX [Corynebacterium marambiense]